jgi:uncharacterized membrane protein YtjA (UPF0391 family)
VVFRGRTGLTLFCAGVLQCFSGIGYKLFAETVKIKDQRMLHYAVVFFVIALIAGILGFSGIAAGAAGIAKILSVVFPIGALISLGRRA